jgi:hypothetical protein
MSRYYYDARDTSEFSSNASHNDVANQLRSFSSSAYNSWSDSAIRRWLESRGLVKPHEQKKSEEYVFFPSSLPPRFSPTNPLISLTQTSPAHLRQLLLPPRPRLRFLVRLGPPRIPRQARRRRASLATFRPSPSRQGHVLLRRRDGLVRLVRRSTEGLVDQGEDRFRS